MDEARKPQFTIADMFYVVTATCIFIAAKRASLGSNLWGIGWLEFFIYAGFAITGFLWLRRRRKQPRTASLPKTRQ